MGKYDDPLTLGKRAAAEAILREAEAELRLIKKLNEAAAELDRLAQKRARLALEVVGEKRSERPALEWPR